MHKSKVHGKKALARGMKNKLSKINVIVIHVECAEVNAKQATTTLASMNAVEYIGSRSSPSACNPLIPIHHIYVRTLEEYIL